MAAGGAFHSLVVTEEGQLLSWGRDSDGQLCLLLMQSVQRAVRLNKKIPTVVQLPGTIKAISACSNHITCYP